MRTGDWRGAGPFAAEWILANGRQIVPDNRPEVRRVEQSDAPEMFALSEIDTSGAWIRTDMVAEVRQ